MIKTTLVALDRWFAAMSTLTLAAFIVGCLTGGTIMAIVTGIAIWKLVKK